MNEIDKAKLFLKIEILKAMRDFIDDTSKGTPDPVIIFAKKLDIILEIKWAITL